MKNAWNRRQQIAWAMACIAIGVAACGGGGGGDGSAPVGAAPAPATTTTPAPAPASNPAPVSAPPPVPAAVTSTETGTGTSTLAKAPVVRVYRDDRVATLEMDYNAEQPAYQFWNMTGSPDDDAGFLVTWWPQATAASAKAKRLSAIMDAGGLCLSPTSPLAKAASAETTRALELPPDAKWLVTANRRVQLQPLDNDRTYQVRVQRLSARGKITSQATEVMFRGGDPTRVNALRASLTHFDDFNLPMGPADEKLWNNAQMVSTDPRFNLFFINDQFHAHTIQGTLLENTGDRSQTSQRFRKKVRIDSASQRRIVFDMDTPLSPRSVWYLDLNPIPTELTGHASFFDEEGDLGLPAGILRLRTGGQELSVSIVDMQGASHRIAMADLEKVGRQAVSNVRRSYDVRVGTSSIQIFVDGVSVINANYAPYSLPAADYELLWVDFGYNTPKDNVYYYLHHWDNFGFDGPVVDPREVRNYVTRIAGTDYQKAQRGKPATFTVQIPDDVRPATAGATAEAWLVATYQMADYSFLNVLPTDFVKVNGGAQFKLPQPNNNSVPLNANANGWGTPHTARIKLGDLTKGGVSPLAVGDNTFQFNVENAGLLNVHVEVLYPPGSAPAYTPPSAIHRFPMHADLPRTGPPVRFQRVGEVDVGINQATIPVSGTVPLNIEAGNASWAGWAPQWMKVPVQSQEVWTTGGTAGLAKIDVFLRKVGSVSGPGTLVWSLDTAVDAPAPQGRYLLGLDTGAYPNGDYELFVQATTPSGLKSHPSYGDETHKFDIGVVSGAYYPVPIRIQN